jgi:hypothetical protein
MKALLSITLCYFLTCELAWAQGGSSAQIHGVVQDPSGAAVPGAEIKATQTAIGAVRTVTSEPDGTRLDEI